MRCACSYGPDGSSGLSSSPSGSRPKGLEHLGRESAKRAHRHASFHFRRRQRWPPRGTGNRPPPGSASRRAGADTGHPQRRRTRPRSCGQRGAQRHHDRGGTSSVVRARARRACVNERDRPGGNASVPPVTIGEQAIGHLDRPHGCERKMTARTNSMTKRRKAAREAVRRSSSGRRSGYVMPTEGRDDQKVRTNEIRTVPTPPDDHNPPGLHDDRPHGRADASGSPRSTAGSPPDRDGAHAPPGLEPRTDRRRSGSARARPVLPSQPWTGQGTLAPYCVTLTPRFANPF